MSYSTARTDYSDQRRSDRDEVFLRTSLSSGRRTGINAQIVNVSRHGLMARTMEPFLEGTQIKILMPLAGEVPGKVVWSLGGRIGCQFDAPIDEKDYPRVLAAIKMAKANWQLG